MKKLLGIINIAAGAIILALLFQLLTQANSSLAFNRPGTVIGLTLFLLVAGTAFASGVRVFRGKHWILAVINLILAGLTVFVLLVANAFATFT